jgi:hypothetical protein
VALLVREVEAEAQMMEVQMVLLAQQILVVAAAVLIKQQVFPAALVS